MTNKRSINKYLKGIFFGLIFCQAYDINSEKKVYKMRKNQVHKLKKNSVCRLKKTKSFNKSQTRWDITIKVKHIKISFR